MEGGGKEGGRRSKEKTLLLVFFNHVEKEGGKKERKKKKKEEEGKIDKTIFFQLGSIETRGKGKKKKEQEQRNLSFISISHSRPTASALGEKKGGRREGGGREGRKKGKTMHRNSSTYSLFPDGRAYFDRGNKEGKRRKLEEGNAFLSFTASRKKKEKGDEGGGNFQPI